ncbi:glycosyltransferase family 2 protein [Yeosuana sp. AK3]
MLTLTLTIITIVYVLWITSFVYGFEKVKPFKLSNLQSKTKFSVIIPFRNERKNLSRLLESIQSLQYPNQLFEVIFVDDDSEDNSVDIIKNSVTSNGNISIISNERSSNSPKKDAISKGIKQAKFPWIVTTDADCILPKYWLNGFDAFIQKANPKCIAAPVAFNIKSGFLNRFQTLDFLSLQGATIGGFGIEKPFLCNGANFAYEKATFMEVNGFEGNANIASGDDIFLLEKITKRYPKQVKFLKCEQAIVTTNAQQSWKELFNQRIRWAAKTSSYNHWFGKLTGLVVLLMNSLVIAAILLFCLGALKGSVLFYFLFIKFNIDVLLIYKAASFYNQKKLLPSVFISFFIYPFFSFYVAFLSIFKGYKWKNRPYKK